MRGMFLGMLSIVLLASILLSEQSHGESVVVYGNGLDAGRKYSSSPRDPSQYQSPISLVDLNPKNKEDDSLNENITNESSFGDGGSITFSMVSEVKGTSDKDPRTGFSEWRLLDDGKKQKVKQTSSATDGSLEESKDIHFKSNDTQSSTENRSYSAVILSDQIRFNGTDYRDRSAYLNEDERLRSSFQSGSITKDSLYIGRFDRFEYDDLSSRSYLNKSSLYRLNTRNVGTMKLDQISNGDDLNKTAKAEISLEYVGAFALRINMNSSKIKAYTAEPDEWLPCCSYSNETMPIYSEMSSRWIRPNATDVLDCTCAMPYR